LRGRRVLNDVKASMVPGAIAGEASSRRLPSAHRRALTNVTVER
jgi:hypothetical protein